MTANPFYGFESYCRKARRDTSIPRKRRPRPRHARVLAECVSAAHDEGQVYAAMRAMRAIGKLPPGDYLAGRFFAHHTDDGEFLDPYAFERLQSLARAYLDSKGK